MNDAVISIDIDGRSFEAKKGQMLIEVADAAGIRIPRFCYHPKLSVAANCRMCLVEVEKAPKPLPACATPVMDGMKVFTQSPLAIKAQKSVMEFLLINHPLDCPICDQGGECELQDVAMGYGRDVSRFVERKRVVTDKNIGPLISTDMTRCIHCTRCVRFGEEIAGMPELGATGRGEHMEIGTFIEANVNSEMSGNVIDVCPVGALTSKPFRFRARAWELQQRDSIAPHDAVGSNVHLHVSRSKVMRVVPRDNEAINEVWISDRDRFSYEGLYSDERLLQPMLKRDGVWQETDWHTALGFAVAGLKNVLTKYGGHQLGGLCAANATLEELYLLQKLLRALDCPNIDHRLRQTDFSNQEQLPPMPLLGQNIADLERLQSALLIGANPRKEHPIVNHRLRKATRAGAQTMFINLRDYPSNFGRSQNIVCDPAEMVIRVAEVARAALGNDLGGPFKKIKASDPAQAIARALSEAQSAAVLLGPGALGHPQASTLRALAARIAEATGASLGTLTEGANAAGAWLSGVVPHRGPAGAPLSAPGLDAMTMLRETLKAYVLLGIEPELDCADSALAMDAMRRAEFVLCFTGYHSEAMREYADVLLPMAGFAETSGTYVNMEGRWQSFAGAVRPQGESRPLWKVLRVMGNMLELEGFEYLESTEVRDELRALSADVDAQTRGEYPLPSTLPVADNGQLYRIGTAPIYATDPLVRRAPALGQTNDAQCNGVRINAELAAKLGFSHGNRAKVTQGSASVTLSVEIDNGVADGCVELALGVPASVGLGAPCEHIEIEKV